MGKKDYKGTILDGRDSFDSWKMDLHVIETAFVRGGAGTRFEVRYFTPGAEIPLAGHPTIATVVALNILLLVLLIRWLKRNWRVSKRQGTPSTDGIYARRDCCAAARATARRLISAAPWLSIATAVRTRVACKLPC